MKRGTGWRQCLPSPAATPGGAHPRRRWRMRKRPLRGALKASWRRAPRFLLSQSLLRLRLFKSGEFIRPCTDADLPRILHIVNEAATAYRGVIPVDCYHEPYMRWDELLAEAREMTFFGWEDSAELVGVIGYQPLGGAAAAPPAPRPYGHITDRQRETSVVLGGDTRGSIQPH